MKRALIDPRSGRIAEIIEPAARREFRVAPPLFWMDMPDDVAPGTHEWRDGAIASVVRSVPPEPTPSLRAAAIEALLDHAATLVTYPQAIRDYVASKR